MRLGSTRSVSDDEQRHDQRVGRVVDAADPAGLGVAQRPDRDQRRKQRGDAERADLRARLRRAHDDDARRRSQPSRRFASSRSTMTQSRHSPSSLPWRRTRRRRGTRNARAEPGSRCSRGRSGQEFQKPALGVFAERASSAARPAPVPRAARATYTECSATPAYAGRAPVGAAPPTPPRPRRLDDDRRKTLTLLGELRRDLLRGPRLGLEGRDPIGDALVVDPGDRRRVHGRRESASRPLTCPARASAKARWRRRRRRAGRR